jgi:hypothetical protein
VRRIVVKYILEVPIDDARDREHWGDGGTAAPPHTDGSGAHLVTVDNASPASRSSRLLGHMRFPLRTERTIERLKRRGRRCGVAGWRFRSAFATYSANWPES